MSKLNKHFFTQATAEALLELAKVNQVDDEFKPTTSSGVENEVLRDAIEKRMEERKGQVISSLANTVITVMDEAKILKDQFINDIRSHRQIVARRLEELKKVDRAIAYGNETSNFLPLFHLTGNLGKVSGHFNMFNDYSDTAAKFHVPTDWVSKNEQPAEQPVAHA